MATEYPYVEIRQFSAHKWQAELITRGIDRVIYSSSRTRYAWTEAHAVKKGQKMLAKGQKMLAKYRKKYVDLAEPYRIR